MTTTTWPRTGAMLLAEDLPEFPAARCRGVDAAAAADFFPPAGGGNEPARTRAKALCGACDEQTACLLWANEHDEHGIWGGRTEAERAGARRPPLTCTVCGVHWSDPGRRGRKPNRCPDCRGLS